MKKHFLQSAAWAKFQNLQGKTVFNEDHRSWSYMAFLEDSSNKFVKSKRLYVPYGPTAENLEDLKSALKNLAELAKKHKAGYIRLEPLGKFNRIDLKILGLRRAERNTQPDLTWQLDLTRSRDEIMKEMSGTNRNLWNTAEKKGIRFEKTYDPAKITLFLEMIHNMAKRTGMRPHSDIYYEQMAESLFPGKAAGLVFGFLEDEPLVGALFFDDLNSKIRYYAHAGSFDSARKLQANSPLLTFLIFDAKDTGLKTFDFYGVSPEDEPNHRWAGFSKFKRSFGGREVRYNGTWELPLNKLNYNFVRSGRKLISKIK